MSHGKFPGTHSQALSPGVPMYNVSLRNHTIQCTRGSLQPKIYVMKQPLLSLQKSQKYGTISYTLQFD